MRKSLKKKVDKLVTELKSFFPNFLDLDGERQWDRTHLRIIVSYYGGKWNCLYSHKNSSKYVIPRRYILTEEKAREYAKEVIAYLQHQRISLHAIYTHNKGVS